MKEKTLEKQNKNQKEVKIMNCSRFSLRKDKNALNMDGMLRVTIYTVIDREK